MEGKEQVTRSVPRIVNVRMTEKGAEDQEFVRFMFRRFGPDRQGWIEKRFMEVQ